MRREVLKLSGKTDRCHRVAGSRRGSRGIPRTCPPTRRDGRGVQGRRRTRPRDCGRSARSCRTGSTRGPTCCVGWWWRCSPVSTARSAGGRRNPRRPGNSRAGSRGGLRGDPPVEVHRADEDLRTRRRRGAGARRVQEDPRRPRRNGAHRVHRRDLRVLSSGTERDLGYPGERVHHSLSGEPIRRRFRPAQEEPRTRTWGRGGSSGPWCGRVAGVSPSPRCASGSAATRRGRSVRASPSWSACTGGFRRHVRRGLLPPSPWRRVNVPRTPVG